jgi:hypothetical protein
MERLTLIARLRLTPTAAGGRETAIRSNYRPTFDLGEWMGEPAVSGGRIMLIDQDELAPDAEGIVRIEPMFPEFWSALRESAIVPVQEGARVVGYATVEKVVFAEGFTATIAAFVKKARAFCTFIEEAAGLSIPDRMLQSRQHLLELCSVAVGLPSVEPPEGTKVARSPDRPTNWSGFGAFENYWEVFDPYDLQEPVAGSLSDDLLDVYRDLRRGLTLWDAKQDAAAVWDWKFHYDVHWGGHSVNALRALHRACSRAER